MKTQKLFKLQVIIIAILIPALLLFILLNLIKNRGNKISGYLHTKNGKIYDQTGKEIILQGINYNELTPLGYVFTPPDLTGLPEVCRRYIPRPPVKLDPLLVSQMGFNVVRLVVNWDQLEPEPDKYNEKYLAALDETVAGLKKNRVAVILDMHQYLWSGAFKYIESEDGWGCAGGGIPAWLYPHPEQTTFQKARCDFFMGKTYFNGTAAQDLFAKAWQKLILRYKDDPAVVGADIINEPWAAKKYCSTEGLNLYKFYEKIGKEIQSVNPKLLLFIEDDQMDGNGDFLISNPPNLSNLVYSIHLYSGRWEPNAHDWMKSYLIRAQKFNLPLFIGEFDGLGLASAVPEQYDLFRLQEFREMINFFKENKIHWAFWSYSGYQSILNPDTLKPKEEILKILQSGM